MQDPEFDVLTDPKIDADNLNEMEDGIDTAHSELAAHIGDELVHLTSDQNDAVDGANSPSASNVFATMADASGDMLESEYDTGAANVTKVVDTADALLSAGSAKTYSDIEAAIDADMAAHATLADEHHSQLHESSHESGGSDELDFDQLSDGTTYKKFTDTERTKLSGIDTGATDDQTGAELVTAINASAGLIDDDNIAASIARDSELHDEAHLLGSHTTDTLANLNAIVTDAILIDTGDSRLSDARAPTAHASDHTDGTDDIQDATNAQKGLATAAQITALEAVDAAVDQSVISGASPTFVGTNVTEIPRANVNIITGAGSPDITDLDDLMNHTGSVGVLHENDGLITDEGATKFQVAAGEGKYRLTGTTTAPLITMAWGAADILYSSLVSGNIYYIYIENVAGTPTVQFTDTASNIDRLKDIGLGFIWFNSENLIVNNPAALYDLADRQHEAIVEMLGYTRVEGAMIGEPANLKLSLTASEWYLGFTEFSLGAIDTNVADTFTYFHRTGATWTEVTSLTDIDNTNYNDTASGLTALTVNRYGVHWIYLNANGGLYVVYGTDDYTIANAIAAATPSTLPPQFAKFCRLVGKAIVQKSGAALYTIESPFTVDFETGVTTVHNDTSGLNDGDFKHLTATEYTDLTDAGDSLAHYHASDRARENHTGTQAAATISDFDTEVTNNSAVAANTAKDTNATHTGDVTGDAELTIAAGSVDIAMHSATGTPSAATFYRGDNVWATPSGSGDVSKVGTPVDNQVGVWTGDGTIEGDAALTFDTATDTLDVGGNITVGGTVDGIDIATDVAANTAKDTNATHTGDVTGDGELTIAPDVVTYDKMQDTSATDTILGRSTAGAGTIEEIACTAAGRALLDDVNAAAQLITLGITASALEVSYMDGVTSAVQTQLGTKAPIANPTFTGEIGIGSVNVNETEFGILEGLTSSTVELNYVSGVSSAIQTQLNAKAASGANSDITSLSGLTTDLSVAQGGTGASTAQAAIDALTAVAGATTAHVLTKDGSGNATFQEAAGGDVNLNYTLQPEGSELPVSNPALYNLVAGSTVYPSHTNLAFDDSTDESAFWWIVTPELPATLNIDIYWYATATTGNVIWNAGLITFGDDDVWLDANPTLSAFAADAAGGTSEDIVKTTLTGYNPSSTTAPNELGLLQITRDANNGSDTMTGDGKIVKIVLTWARS